MGYLHIDNLYKNQSILLFRRCWALEKVHGTSAHVVYRADSERLSFASGGEKHERFVQLFDHDDLRARFAALGHAQVTVFGEAYGGSQQGMRDSYGPSLRFIGFDVRIGERWLSVPDMAQVLGQLGVECVPYEEITTDLVELDRVRDLPSEVAVRRLGPEAGPRRREGVILRPLFEMITNDGQRVIAKHKLEAFSERATPQKVIDPAKLQVLADASAIAQEWVTLMRLEHVLDKLEPPHDIGALSRIIKAMIEDISREAAGEIVDSKEARAAIGRRTAELFKARSVATARNVE